jgi:hypothetical protein
MKPGGLAAFKLYVSTGFNLYSEPHRALLRPLHGGGQISASHLHGGRGSAARALTSRDNAPEAYWRNAATVNILLTRKQIAAWKPVL